MGLLPALLFATQVAAADPCTDCNLLWIVIDTTRADHVGAFGGDPQNTPNLDALAARGTAFDQAHTQGPDTMVSVGSYFSGRYRRNVGLDFSLADRASRFVPMPGAVTTVAEALQGAGFTTRGMTANMVIAGKGKWNLEMHQGFGTWNSGVDAEVAAWGAAQLGALKDERFFLYLHLMGPHYPNAELPGFEARRGPHERLGVPEGTHIYGSLNRGQITLTEGQAAYLRALYADGLWAADQQLGQVFAALEAHGLTDKTVVIFTSDHGEALGELHLNKPTWGHGHALTKPLLHVPLIMSGPGIAAGHRERAQIAELVDVAPTVASLLGVPVDPTWGWVGEPLLGPDKVVGRWSISDRGASPTSNASIRNATRAVLWWEKRTDKVFCSDLRADPTETRWIPADVHHDELEATLRAYIDSAIAPEVGIMEGPDAATLEALQQLGYLEE